MATDARTSVAGTMAQQNSQAAVEALRERVKDAATTPNGLVTNPDFLDRLYSYGVFLTFTLAALVYWGLSLASQRERAPEPILELALVD